MKVMITMVNGSIFDVEKEDLNLKNFPKFIEIIGNKCDSFLHWEGKAVNIRQISSIEIIKEDK